MRSTRHRMFKVNYNEMLGIGARWGEGRGKYPPNECSNKLIQSQNF